MNQDIQPRLAVIVGVVFEICLVFFIPSCVFAAPAATSAYITDPQETHVEDATSSGLKTVNMLTCLMGALAGDKMVNQGAYKALIDESKCDQSGDSTNNSSSTVSGSARYTTATVSAIRTSNSDPMTIKAWVRMGGQLINARALVSEPASNTNPYGVFRLDFQRQGKGFINASANGLSFYEDEDGTGSRVKRLKINSVTSNTGSGTMSFMEGSTNKIFNFVYNEAYFRRNFIGSSDPDQCFSRSMSDSGTGFSVWRYGLYDSDTGAQINRNSGFPIKYTASGVSYDGYLGYWGLWLPSDALINDGATVSKVNYSNGNATTTDYTLTKLGGRLTKYTKSIRTLAAIDQIEFNATFCPNNQCANYQAHWDEASGTFKLTGKQSSDGPMGSLGPSDPVGIAKSSYSNFGIWGWSPSLGGQVFIDLNTQNNANASSAINVILHTQDIVYPADMPAHLYCVQDCPTAASMAAYFAGNGIAPISPFIVANNWGATVAGNVVQYAIGNGVLKDVTNAAVIDTTVTHYESKPQYQWGIRTGAMLADLSGFDCGGNNAGSYCSYKANDADSYYVWETGPNSQNQFAAVKDSNGNYTKFDAPLPVNFTVPNETKYGNYKGKTISLQYGGFGDLNGIPGKCVDMATNAPANCATQNSGIRYVPEFVIPYGQTQGVVTHGSTTYLVKWLNREVRFARRPALECTLAGLSLLSAATLPTEGDWQNPSIGAEPAVNDAPKVIHGRVN